MLGKNIWAARKKLKKASYSFNKNLAVRQTVNNEQMSDE